MSVALDISKGIDPVPMFSDIRNDAHHFRFDGFSYTFRTQLPFTVRTMILKVGGKKRNYECADKELILKHKDKAIVKDLRTLEVVK